MLPSLAALFDRIVTNRLNLWIRLSVMNSLLSRGEINRTSIIYNTFTRRNCEEPDHFDKVSRYLLIKKLVANGSILLHLVHCTMAQNTQKLSVRSLEYVRVLLPLPYCLLCLSTILSSI